jgi:DNA-binding IclR family transcriptional regulator
LKALQRKNREKFMTELTSQELALLKVLANEWETSGPPGYLETTEIAKALKIPISEVKSIIHSLFVMGIVGTDQLDLYAAYLTPEGFDLARGK